MGSARDVIDARQARRERPRATLKLEVGLELPRCRVGRRYE
jgi:hypothetical protein